MLIVDKTQHFHFPIKKTHMSLKYNIKEEKQQSSTKYLVIN